MSDLKLTYGAHVVDFATVPPQSVTAMLRRGFSHFLGSEQASKVTAYFDPDRKLAEGEARLEDTEENRQKVKADYQAKAVDALLAGTVGMSTRGPSIDPITTVINRLARAEVGNILKASGVKPPKKAEDTVEIGGQKFTMEQLVSRRLDPTKPYAERLGKEAAKIVADQAKKAAKALEAAKADGLEAL